MVTPEYKTNSSYMPWFCALWHHAVRFLGTNVKFVKRKVVAMKELITLALDVEN